MAAIKIFMGSGRRDWASLTELIRYPGSKVVIVRRNPDTEECSFNYSLATGHWHNIDKGREDAWKREHCQARSSQGFRKAHNDWFRKIYALLKHLGKRWMEMPFESFVTDVPAARDRLHTFAQLPEGDQFRQDRWCPKTPGLAAA